MNWNVKSNASFGSKLFWEIMFLRFCSTGVLLWRVAFWRCVIGSALMCHQLIFVFCVEFKQWITTGLGNGKALRCVWLWQWLYHWICQCLSVCLCICISLAMFVPTCFSQWCIQWCQKVFGHLLFIMLQKICIYMYFLYFLSPQKNIK